MSATVEFDKKVVCNSEYVALRIVDHSDKLEVNGILIPDQAYGNDRLAHYIVESVGDVAAKEYGLKVGDYVVADRLAAFYPSKPVCCMKYNSVIAKTNADRSKYYPLKNMVFVDEPKEDITDVGGVLVNNYSKNIKTGKVISMNIEDGITVPYEVGDKVMLVKGGDVVAFGTQKIFIFKHDMIIAKIID